MSICVTTKHAFNKEEDVYELISLLYIKVLRFNEESRTFMECIRVISCQFETVEYINDLIKWPEFLSAFENNENIKYFCELIVQCIKQDESGLFGYIFITECLDILTNLEDKIFRIKKYVVHMMYKIIKKTNIEIIKDHCISAIHVILESYNIDALISLKMFAFIIKNGMIEDTEHFEIEALQEKFDELKEELNDEQLNDYKEIIDFVDDLFPSEDDD